MPVAGDRFKVTLKAAHLRWGTLGNSRKSNKRSKYEAYVQIPLSQARVCTISTGTIFNGTTSDGFFSTQVRASGSAGDNLEFAKQFQGSGNLKLFGYWFQHINAKPGDIIQVDFITPKDVLFTKL
ncbi:hypothetical protein [Paenibacillus sp. PAMC 26794]|uniref:hypothetical protein n=1 Tax=Paenibacillus sp. PAMC 26794 TaxID=1257080 RepID=UPI000366213B|nr:hypothetical protein [Paenibacillus sp. PAMC 26794]